MEETLKEFLENYDMEQYPRPSCTADVAVLTHDFQKILLIKRKNHPWKDCFALPGGFMNIDETLEQTALRELKEETSLDYDGSLLQVHTFSDVKRDPRGRIITTLFLAVLENGQEKDVQANDDAADAKFFKLEADNLKWNDEGLSVDIKVSSGRIVYEFKAKYTNKTDKLKITYKSDNHLAADHAEALVRVMMEVGTI